MRTEDPASLFELRRGAALLRYHNNRSNKVEVGLLREIVLNPGRTLRNTDWFTYLSLNLR
ncbi:MAG: hypothetical protein AAF546_06805 [Verrucomicrobiota bacterium]